MSKNIKLIRILVSSPSDVQSERDALEAVINELNLGQSKTEIRFELIRWETHSSPQVGTDTQAILNQQLGDDYDIFLGILWHRIGTPTPRADSGTIEEFDRAYARYKSNSGDISIMFYFKNAPIPPDDIIPEQFSRVRQFRESIRETTLYDTFTSLDEFTRLIRIHLTRWRLEFQRRTSSTLATTVAQSPKIDSEQSDSEGVQKEVDSREDDGILDLIERGNTSMAVMSEIAGRLAASMQSLGEDVATHTSRLNAVTASGEVSNVREVRREIDSVAQRLDYFAEQVDSELIPMRKAARDAFDSLGRVSQITLESGSDIRKPVSDNASAALSLASVLDTTSEQIEVFRGTVVAMPRMTSRLNRAKRHASDVLIALKSELNGTAKLARQTSELLYSLLKNRTGDSEK